MLGSRLLTGLIMALFLIIVLLADSMVLQIIAFIAAILVLFELYKATAILKKGFLFILGFLPLAALFVNSISTIGLLVYFYIAVLFAFMLVNNKRIRLKDIAAVFMLGFFVTFMIKHIIMLRQLELGGFLIWAVFVSACMSDTFAYASGRLFGRHKLCPVISPKKTVEGAAGALVGTMISMLIYGGVLTLFDLSVNFALLAILGLVSSVFAQLGDLSASIIKRECQIKDFGSVLPGHGGFFDRFDSILFVAPIIYYAVILLPIITK